MTTNTYNNLPASNSNSSNATISAMDNYYSTPFELHAGTFNLMKGFFESKGFEKSSAETIAVTIMKQAKLDKFNPMEVLDNLKGLDSLELNSTVSELLNFNRFKTSLLGHATGFTPFAPVARNIIDGIVTKVQTPIYTIQSSVDTVNEGQQVTFLITTETLNVNSVLYWSLSGANITTGDIQGGSVSGTVVISNSEGSVTVPIAEDLLTEGNEILFFNIREYTNLGPGPTLLASASVVINDTSFAAIADYIVVEYTFDTGSDLDTRTRVAVPSITDGSGHLYVGWGQGTLLPASPVVLKFGGDNTGIGRESAVFDVGHFKTLYPSTNNIVIDCRAQWYGTVGTTPVGLKITLYQGGAINQVGYGFENPTATSSTVLNLTLKYITLQSIISTSVGERIATLNYNLLTGVGSVNSTDVTVYP